MADPHLYFFEPFEFVRNKTEWFDLIDPRLLVTLDILRFKWGRPIFVSGHKKAVGRRSESSPSQHNIARWGKVRAVDIQPQEIRDLDDAYRFYLLVVELGFTGIGFYPGWNDGPGFHLDVRRDTEPGNPATWGCVYRDGQRVDTTIGEAFVDLIK